MADASGLLQRGQLTAYVIKEGGTGFISAVNLETAGNRDWDDIAGTDKLIVDANRIPNVTLISAINESASTDTETLDFYWDDDSKTLSTTTDVELDPIEFTAQVDFAATAGAAVKLLPGGADAAAVGSTKYLLAIVAKTADTAQTALVTVATLTRRQIDPAATGASLLTLGFTSVDHNIYRVAQS